MEFLCLHVQSPQLEISKARFDKHVRTGQKSEPQTSPSFVETSGALMSNLTLFLQPAGRGHRPSRSRHSSQAAASAPCEPEGGEEIPTPRPSGGGRTRVSGGLGYREDEGMAAVWLPLLRPAVSSPRWLHRRCWAEVPAGEAAPQQCVCRALTQEFRWI